MDKLLPIKQSFQVQYDYQLYFTSGLFSRGNQLLADLFSNYSEEKIKILVIVDEGVVKAHHGLSNQIKEYANTHRDSVDLKEVIVVQGGEDAKVNEKSLKNVLEAINENGICRHSFVLAIGGGAVIDMVGYAAATAHRGVKLIRIPTTVLAQNDAAVGVKNGINSFGKKKFLRNLRATVCNYQRF